MLNDQRALVVTTTSASTHDHHDHEHHPSPAVRDIHAVAPPHPQPWDLAGRGRSPSLTTDDGDNFSSMSREFNALVVAGSAIVNPDAGPGGGLNGIHEQAQEEEETNPLAIVLDSNPAPSGSALAEVSVERVKKEEVEARIIAWQNAKIAKINNRFKREDAVINGWEGEEVQKANSWMKKVERKLEEKRAKAREKMQNDMAKARRKAEERRASAEAKRGTKVAKVMDVANLMRAVGRAPVKRSFF